MLCGRLLLGIEGNSGVGKTVTAQEVARRLGGDFFPEPGTYIDCSLGEHVPAFPGLDVQAAVAASGIWPTAERRREACRASSAARPLRQVTDCTTVSILAFELAKARFGYPHAVEPLVSEYLHLYDAEVLEEPTLWAFLTASSAVVLERIRRRGGSRPFLKLEQTMEYLDRVRRLFAETFVPRLISCGWTARPCRWPTSSTGSSPSLGQRRHRASAVRSTTS